MLQCYNDSNVTDTATARTWRAPVSEFTISFSFLYIAIYFSGLFLIFVIFLKDISLRLCFLMVMSQSSYLALHQQFFIRRLTSAFSQHCPAPSSIAFTFPRIYHAVLRPPKFFFPCCSLRPIFQVHNSFHFSHPFVISLGR